MECLPCQAAAKRSKDIINGYANLVLSVLVPDSEVEILATERMEICSNCSFRTNLIKINNIQYYKCKSCGCPLDAATRSTEYSCKEGKW